MKTRYSTASLIALLLLAQPLFAQDREYRPGGEEFAPVWNRFYQGDYEPELDDPLIDAGAAMTLVICEAVKNKDMKMRRYAIGALGYLGDPRALSTLEAILKSKAEIDYFRGDALHSIYQIDQALGKRYAREYGHENEPLKMMQESIEKGEAWLLEPTE